MRIIKRKYNTKPNQTSFKKGHRPLVGAFGKGDKMPEKSKKLISQSLLGRVGVLARNWRGGISGERSVTSPRYEKWRMSVFERDNWTCQGCGIRGCYLEAHHVKSWSKYSELRFDVENGVALCKDCHKLTDNYKGKGARKNA